MIYFYIIGCVLAFMLAIYHASREENWGNSIEDLPNALPVLTFMSWFYIIMFIFREYERKNKQQ